MNDESINKINNDINVKEGAPAITPPEGGAGGKTLVTTKTGSSIATRLTLYITLLIFGIMVVVSIYLSQIQKNLLMSKMTDKADTLNKNLLVSFRDAILSNQLMSVQNSVEEVKSNDQLVDICEVYDEDMRCMASSFDPNRGNTTENALVRESIKSLSMQMRITESKEFLEIAMPLTIAKKARGSLYIRYSLAAMNAEIKASYMHSILICLAAIMIGWIISIFVSRKITTPIFNLVDGANEVLKGNYDHKISRMSDDETGIISSAFNTVTGALALKIRELSEYSDNLARINAELDKKINELKSLQELGKVISSIFNLEELLRAIIQNAMIVMKSKRCSIVLVHEKTGDFYIKVAKGLEETGDFIENMKLRTGGLVTDYCIKQKEPLLVTDMVNDERFPGVQQTKPRDDKKYKTVTFIAVPLIVNDKVIGVISITEKLSDDIYNESDLQLLQIFANQVVIAIENAKLYEKLVVRERLERELEIAHNIQMNMLPQKYPDIKGISIAGVAIPAKEVGGDYYDFLPISDSRVGITIGDVSGKGVPAALMMVMIRSILRAKVMTQHNPKDIVLELNNLMLNELEPRMFITLFYMILDIETKEIKYTNAGHNYPMIFHADNEEVESLKDGGLLLGIFQSPMYEEGTYQLREGDVVVMYTDGIVEAMNENDEMFEYDNLCSLVHRIKNKNAEAIKADIIEATQKFMGDAPQYDDLTLIVIKVEKDGVKTA